MDDGQRGGVYEFAEFRLLAAQRRLVTRADARPIDLTQKALDALLYLVRHPGELLDKATLLKAIWPNVVVEENNLNQVISGLRRAIGDGSGGQRFIVTVPGRGYQFVAPVVESKDTVAPAVAAAPVSAPASAGARGPAHHASIAVLPFASLSSDPEKDFFGDGIAEELIHLLARVPGLKVPARTSSFAYKGRNIDVRQIGRDLGVAMLLEGSVRSAGDRIRVTAQLVEAESGFHIWSQTYDRQFADVFQLQDELAGAITQALKISMGDRQAPSLREAPPTKNVEAYRLFMQARAMWNHSAGSHKGGERMLELLQRAVELDPGFARAHAQLGVVKNFLFTLGAYGADILVEAQRSAEQALILDPELGEAHTLIGAQRATRGEWLAAEVSFQRAVALDPDEPLTRTSYALFVLGPSGKLQQALEQSCKAYHLAPAFVACAINVAGFSSAVGRDDEANAYVRVALDLGIPEQQLPLPIFRSVAACRAGRHAEAAAYMMAAIPAGLRAQGGDALVRLVYAALADARQAPSAVAALRALNKSGDPAILDAWPMIMLTLHWRALLGALDDAYETAQRMVRDFTRTGTLNAVNVMPLWLPELLTFRRDPRFRDLAAGLGLIDYWKERGPPDNCELQDGRLVVR